MNPHRAFLLRVLKKPIFYRPHPDSATSPPFEILPPQVEKPPSVPVVYLIGIRLLVHP